MCGHRYSTSALKHVLLKFQQMNELTKVLFIGSINSVWMNEWTTMLFIGPINSI